MRNRITGKDIKKLRKSQQLTVREFAHALGVVEGTIRTWERHREKKLSPLAERAVREFLETAKKEEKAISEEIRENRIPLKI